MKPSFAQHRQRFIEALGRDFAILFAPPHRQRNADSEYKYRTASDVYYLSGWDEPEAVLLFRPHTDQPFVMFVQPNDPDKEVWTGRRPGPEGAKERWGADAAYSIEELGKRLPSLLVGTRQLHHAFGEDPEHDLQVTTALKKAKRLARKTKQDTPDALIHPRRILHELRLKKSDEELAILRASADRTRRAHIEAMAMTRPGVFEYELEARMDHVFRSSGGNGPGYSSIVGGGVNATVLHYVRNNDVLKDGDLVCVDAGCEYHYYTTDVTRTWPVNGRFSPAQRELYQLVLDSQLAAIAAIQPGAPYANIHDAATRVLVEGMVRLGLLEGKVETLIENEDHKRYYMHGTSHWLGLDVHDAGVYHHDGTSRSLEPGMVTTVEPGIYISPTDDKAPEKYRGIGIRIEDDVVVTEDGHEVLTVGIPKDIDEVEAAVGRASAGRAAAT